MDGLGISVGGFIDCSDWLLTGWMDFGWMIGWNVWVIGSMIGSMIGSLTWWTDEIDGCVAWCWLIVLILVWLDIDLMHWCICLMYSSSSIFYLILYIVLICLTDWPSRTILERRFGPRSRSYPQQGYCQKSVPRKANKHRKNVRYSVLSIQKGHGSFWEEIMLLLWYSRSVNDSSLANKKQHTPLTYVLRYSRSMVAR